MTIGFFSSEFLSRHYVLTRRWALAVLGLLWAAAFTFAVLYVLIDGWPLSYLFQDISACCAMTFYIITCAISAREVDFWPYFLEGLAAIVVLIAGVAAALCIHLDAEDAIEHSFTGIVIGVFLLWCLVWVVRIRAKPANCGQETVSLRDQLGQVIKEKGQLLKDVRRAKKEAQNANEGAKRMYAVIAKHHLQAELPDPEVVIEGQPVGAFTGQAFQLPGAQPGSSGTKKSKARKKKEKAAASQQETEILLQ